MKNCIISILLGFYFLVMVTGCGGGGGGSSATSAESVSGSVVMGYMSGATVTFFSLNSDGTRAGSLGATTTDANGGFTVSIPSIPSTPFLAETSGGSYVDESSGAAVDLTSNDHLCAVLPGGTTNAAITSLTHMACLRAVSTAAAGVDLDDAVASANAGVAQQFNLTNIISVMPVDATSNTDNQTAVQNARLYGIVLAGIAQEANDMGLGSRGAFDLTLALADDASDGNLDGMTSGVSVSIPNSVMYLDGSEGLTGLQTAIDTFLAGANNNTNLDTAQVGTTAIEIGINTAGSLYSTTAALPAWTYDEAGTASITVSGGAGPYTCAVTSGSAPSGLSLSSDCTLAGTISGPGSMTIFPPFTATVTDAVMNTLDVILYVTVVPAGPSITAVTSGNCYAGMACNVLVATASGGSAPLYFTNDTLNPPPTGMVIDLNGNLTGTAPSSEGVQSFGICVVDSVGAYRCTATSITVKSAVSAFDGPYDGSYSGTANSPLSPDPINVSGTISVTVSDGAITGTVDGSGAVTGSINASGVVTMGAVTTDCTASFTGTASSGQQGNYASGSWSCDLDGGGSASGTWYVVMP